jgi:hypothetical protein
MPNFMHKYHNCPPLDMPLLLIPPSQAQLPNMKSIFSLALLPLALFAGISSAHPPCRCLPSDDCWPSDKVWAKFNSTVNGALIKTVPLGSPCHEPNYDEDACAAVKGAWKWPMTQYVRILLAKKPPETNDG